MVVSVGSAGRVLVVDDHTGSARVIGALLERHGYTVMAATDARQALCACGQDALPDLVLLDMTTPGQDAFGVLAAVRAQAGCAELPVVFMTAVADRDLLPRAFRAGVVDFVTHPFVEEELLARVHAHVTLKLIRDRLERLARERGDLINLVAHDLRNPLTTIVFAADAIRRKVCPPERTPRYMETIHDSATDALGYVGDYLDREAGRARREPCPPCGLNALVDWLVKRYELQLEAHGMQVEIIHGPDGAMAALPERVFRQVAENLIVNAMKYAPNQPLLLEVRQDLPAYWQLIVADRGPGIPTERRDELFKPFTRLTDEHAEGSSGLGLSLAKRIVADWGGELRYRPREGGGSVFVIELPTPLVLPVADGADAVSPARAPREAGPAG
ncbi:MAG TPA: hybrid sensor histidine kinase/response regulator [Lysobacter sp.]|nr:hybrid sensor histidine kinase/response regulator [Lysobacter sp.]